MAKMENINIARRHVLYIEDESRLKEIINHAIARQGFVTGMKKALHPVQMGFCFSRVTRNEILLVCLLSQLAGTFFIIQTTPLVSIF